GVRRRVVLRAALRRRARAADEGGGASAAASTYGVLSRRGVSGQTPMERGDRSDAAGYLGPRQPGPHRLCVGAVRASTGREAFAGTDARGEVHRCGGDRGGVRRAGTIRQRLRVAGPVVR